MQLPYSEQLKTEYLGKIFEKKAESYKLFWFSAIVTNVLHGKVKLTFEEIIDEMIADAWYMVTEYHLSLGPKDTVEVAVKLLKEKNPNLKSNEDKSVILKVLRETKDEEILSKKKTLVNEVPFRLQTPFLPTFNNSTFYTSKSKLVELINSEDDLLYYFSEYKGLSTTITIVEEWANYIIKNQQIIQGWLEFQMVKWLQKRNPSVPGISDKLYPPKERKLKSIISYWKLIISRKPILDIYGNNLLSDADLSIDHFIPWSYVAHDEMWNLSPTTRSINSSKSNNLPEWNNYFKPLADQEYETYLLMWSDEAIHKEFEKCAREYVNNDDVRYKIYREGLQQEEFQNALESVIKPVYQSAQNCGFGSWHYDK